MNRSTKEKIKQKIKNEIQVTESRIKEYKKSSSPISPDNSIGRVSRMDAINNKSVLESALRKAEEKLKKLKQVQKKINNPDFNYCSRCKNKIPLARIIIVPESKYCVNCA